MWHVVKNNTKIYLEFIQTPPFSEIDFFPTTEGGANSGGHKFLWKQLVWGILRNHFRFIISRNIFISGEKNYFKSFVPRAEIREESAQISTKTFAFFKDSYENFPPRILSQRTLVMQIFPPPCIFIIVLFCWHKKQRILEISNFFSGEGGCRSWPGARSPPTSYFASKKLSLDSLAPINQYPPGRGKGQSGSERRDPPSERPQPGTRSCKVASFNGISQRGGGLAYGVEDFIGWVLKILKRGDRELDLRDLIVRCKWCYARTSDEFWQHKGQTEMYTFTMSDKNVWVLLPFR